jgi:hypothetical protein
VSLVSWEYLVDAYPGVQLNTPTGAIVEVPRPAGLYAAGAGGQFASATPKPFLRGFQLPFDPLRVNARQLRVWALLMHGGQPALLQQHARTGRWHTIAHLRANASAVINALVDVRGAMRLRLRVGGLLSAPASVARGRSGV